MRRCLTRAERILRLSKDQENGKRGEGDKQTHQQDSLVPPSGRNDVCTRHTKRGTVPLFRFYFFPFYYILPGYFCTVQYQHTFHFHIRIICDNTKVPLLFTPATVPVFYTPLFRNTNSVLHWTCTNLYFLFLHRTLMKEAQVIEQNVFGAY